jgi:nucleotide-binding universal stress UspA family protein
MLGELYPDRVELAEDELESFAAAELHGLKTKRIVLPGDPASTIVQYARTAHVGLIVMPTHGYGPFRRFVLGSTTAKVLHDSDTPVFTGAHLEESQPTGGVKFDTVVCAVDFTEQCKTALAWAAEFAGLFGSRLYALHAVPVASGQGGQEEPANSEWGSAVQMTAASRLKELLREAGADAVPIITGGEAVHAVCRQLTELQADLLVIGRSSSSGLLGRLRTNAYALIRESHCPVVSV